MGAAYSFVSTWRVPAAPERCWTEMERMLRPGARASWWPGLTVLEPPSVLEAGESLVLAVRSPLGYRLVARLTLTDVDAGRLLAAASDGDLRGTGRMEIAGIGVDVTSVAFHWDVTTERRWMNATAPLLRPLFERAHARVMRRGREGLEAVLGADAR